VSPKKVAVAAPAPSSKVPSMIKDSAALAAGRERLLKGARTCFASKGYGGTSVQDIANAAGISVGSLYKYVRAKEDLLFLMAEASHSRLNDVVTSAFTSSDDPREALCVTVDALIRNADEDRDLMNLLYAEFKYMPPDSKRLIREQEKTIVKRLVALIESGNARGVFTCAQPQLAAIDIEMFGSTWVLKSHLISLTLATYVERQTAIALRMVGAVA
jgi:AcrR family transcriptional regulator